MEQKQSKCRESIIVSGDYDPLERAFREQASFNDTWIGQRPAKGWVQQLGFFIISAFIAAGGLLLSIDTFRAMSLGVVYGFAAGAFMTAVGLSGLFKAARDLATERSAKKRGAHRLKT